MEMFVFHKESLDMGSFFVQNKTKKSLEVGSI